MPRRHVCTNQRNISYPIRTKRVYAKPTYKKYMVRCGNQWCEGVRLVYEKYHRESVANANHTQVDYTCCPGWTQVNYRSHGCNKPVCTPPCYNGGRCVKPNVCHCPPGYDGTYCETKTSVYVPTECSSCCPSNSCKCVCLCQSLGQSFCPVHCPTWGVPCPDSCASTCPSACPPQPCCTQVCTPVCIPKTCPKHNGLQDDVNECIYVCPVCLNGGTCRPPTCVCPPGFTGNQCQTAQVQTDCSMPCKNGGTCTSKSVCICPPGFTGKLCDKDIDECREKPCDQICYNTPGSYECECKESFVLQKDGQTCRKENDDDSALEAKDLESQHKLDKMDKRVQKIEKILRDKSRNEVTKKDLNNIYGNIDKISNDIGNIACKLQRLESYSKDIDSLRSLIDTVDKRTLECNKPPTPPPPPKKSKTRKCCSCARPNEHHPGCRCKLKTF